MLLDYGQQHGYMCCPLLCAIQLAWSVASPFFSRACTHSSCVQKNGGEGVVCMCNHTRSLGMQKHVLFFQILCIGLTIGCRDITSCWLFHLNVLASAGSFGKPKYVLFVLRFCIHCSHESCADAESCIKFCPSLEHLQICMPCV
jgi:hypothetical protein